MANKKPDGQPHFKAIDETANFDLAILQAVHNLRYGSVEVTVHDSKVVQIECKEKIRFQPGNITAQK
jgi:hypothetical protein